MAESAIWPALLVAAVATYAWRAVGVLLSGRLDVTGPTFSWIACVAYALLAGLVARMILLPTGPLAEAPLLDRLAAAALALAAFFATRQRILPGVAAGFIVLALAASMRGLG